MAGELPKQRRYRWLIVALVLIIIGVALIIVSQRGPVSGPGIPGPIGQAAGTTNATSPVPVMLASDVKTKTSPYLSRSVPVHISIPAIGISVSVGQVGKTATGDVAVPTSWGQPGWYKYGPTPGQEGSAAILGHVDSVNGPAVFYNLAKLRPGNDITVTLADKKVVKFVVIGLRQYSKDNFPSKVVYGPRPYAAMQLITCAGEFDESTHHYLSNLVVFTKMVKPKVKAAVSFA